MKILFFCVFLLFCLTISVNSIEIDNNDNNIMSGTGMSGGMMGGTRLVSPLLRRSMIRQQPIFQQPIQQHRPIQFQQPQFQPQVQPQFQVRPQPQPQLQSHLQSLVEGQKREYESPLLRETRYVTDQQQQPQQLEQQHVEKERREQPQLHETRFQEKVQEEPKIQWSNVELANRLHMFEQEPIKKEQQNIYGQQFQLPIMSIEKEQQPLKMKKMEKKEKVEEQPALSQEEALKSMISEAVKKPTTVAVHLTPTLTFTSSPSITTSIHSANQFVTPSITSHKTETTLNNPTASTPTTDASELFRLPVLSVSSPVESKFEPKSEFQQPIYSGVVGVVGEHHMRPIYQQKIEEEQMEQQPILSLGLGERERERVGRVGQQWSEQEQQQEQERLMEQQPITNVGYQWGQQKVQEQQPIMSAVRPIRFGFGLGEKLRLASGLGLGLQQSPILEKGKERLQSKSLLSFRPLFTFPIMKKSEKGMLYFSEPSESSEVEESGVVSESGLLQSPVLGGRMGMHGGRMFQQRLSSLDLDDLSEENQLKLEKYRLKLKLFNLKNLFFKTKLNNLLMKQNELKQQQVLAKKQWGQQYALESDLSNKYKNRVTLLKMRLRLMSLKRDLLKLKIRRFLTKLVQAKHQQKQAGVLSTLMIVRPMLFSQAIKQQRLISKMKNKISKLQSKVLALRKHQSTLKKQWALKERKGKEFGFGLGLEKKEKKSVKGFGLTELPLEKEKEEMETEKVESGTDQIKKQLKFSFEGLKTGDEDEDNKKRKMNVVFDFDYPRSDDVKFLSRDASLSDAGGYGNINFEGGGFKSNIINNKRVTRAGKLNILLNMAKKVTDVDQEKEQEKYDPTMMMDMPKKETETEKFDKPEFDESMMLEQRGLFGAKKGMEMERERGTEMLRKVKSKAAGKFQIMNEEQEQEQVQEQESEQEQDTETETEQDDEQEQEQETEQQQ